jgi:Cu/Ag efflux protein CusF
MKTLLLAVALALFTQGTDPNIAAKHAIGEVKTIDAAAKQLTIQTDAGSTVTFSISDKTT